MRQSERGDAATTELVVGSVDDDEGGRKGGKEGPYMELRGTSRSAKLTLTATRTVTVRGGG
jgi:hypothetical protein